MIPSPSEPAKAPTASPGRPARLAHRLLQHTGRTRATPRATSPTLLLALPVHRARLGRIRGLEEQPSSLRRRARGGLLVAGPGRAASAAGPLPSSALAGRVAARLLARSGGPEDALAGLGVLALFLDALFRGARFARFEVGGGFFKALLLAVFVVVF
jgi:hypothetical protein